ncbi:WecB/TagA/CpsF family glycosyltransferase [Salinicoccus sp. CNSTN-B1]
MSSHYSTVPIMGVHFIDTTLDGFLNQTIYPALYNRDKCFIVTANPEFLMATQNNPKFKAIVQSADYVLPDGIGIVRAASMLGTPLKARVSGFDVAQGMLKHAAQNGYRVFFIGASEDSNEKAVQKCNGEIPRSDRCRQTGWLY